MSMPEVNVKPELPANALVNPFTYLTSNTGPMAKQAGDYIKLIPPADKSNKNKSAS